MALNESLKKARKLKKKTAEDMASLLGYESKTSYYNIENGVVEVTLSTAQKISIFLDEPIEKLFPKFFKHKVQGNRTSPKSKAV